MPGAYSTREAEDPPFATPGPEADPTFSVRPHSVGHETEPCYSEIPPFLS